MRAVSLLCTLPLLLAVACGDREDASTSDSQGGSGGSDGGSGGSPTGGTGGTGGDGDGGTGGIPEPKFRSNAAGEVTWQVTFDEDAIAAGATDCSYTRTYDAVQNESAKWLCPSCEIMFVADVEMTAGATDCFTQISDLPPSELEWFGWGNGVFYRGVGAGMSDQGTVAIDGDTVTTENQVLDLEHEAGGTFQFDVAGTFTLVEEEGDPLHGFNVPDTYACGWPKSDEPAYTGNYRLEVGQKVPDGVFLDTCEEAVRLHDFKGSYLIIDMSAVDCPACKTMAGGEADFVEDMTDAGVDVEVITLLAPSLSDPLGETTTSKLELWTNGFKLESPVLADRGWGLTMFLEAIEGDVGYPSWVLVDPELNVVEFGSAYPGWNVFAQKIQNHMGQ